MEHSINSELMGMHDLLFDHFGPRNWWPGETALEIIVGAILTQNTNWKNVEKAIGNLKRNNLLSMEKLHDLPREVLADVIRPAGYYNVKAKRLKNLIDFIYIHHHGDLPLFLDLEKDRLREELLRINGVGPETADSILLYAAERPVFVVDTYTHRILNRHGMVEESVSYDELQALFMERLPDDSRLFNEFHALIVLTGKEFCRKKPLCAPCPLRHWGPISPEQST